MTERQRGPGGDIRHRRRAHRAAMTLGIALSALLHALVLFQGRLTVPDAADTPEQRARAGDEPALRLVTIAPEPTPPDEPALAPAGTPPVPSGEPSPATEAGAQAGAPSLDLPALTPAAAGRIPTPGSALAGSGIATFDLRPNAPAAGSGAGEAVAVEAKGPGLLRRVLGGLLEGVSVAIRVPCGSDGAPGGEAVPGGTPVVPDAGGMPGMPGVTAGIPTGPGAIGMPEPEVIGMPAVPGGTFGGTDGPVAGVDGRGALGGLIGCSDGSRRGGGMGGGIGGPGGRSGPGGIFRPGGF